VEPQRQDFRCSAELSARACSIRSTRRADWSQGRILTGLQRVRQLRLLRSSTDHKDTLRLVNTAQHLVGLSLILYSSQGRYTYRFLLFITPHSWASTRTALHLVPAADHGSARRPTQAAIVDFSLQRKPDPPFSSPSLEQQPEAAKQATYRSLFCHSFHPCASPRSLSISSDTQILSLPSP
jgi:hypothetical protein